MNKEKSRSPKKHEFLLNLAKSPPLSVDHFDFISLQPHSKDSFNEEDDQISLHHERVATATDYPLGKNPHGHASLSQGKRSHSKKKSVEHPKDAVTYLLSTPSSTTNAKANNKSSQSRTISRSNTAHHLNFLNSKEFAKFALSKVLPKENKKDKAIHIELSPQQKRSQAGSVEKSPSKSFPKEENGGHPKYHMAATKKQKVKPRASNLTYNDFSSLVDQTRQIHSFMNSPQKKSGIQISIPSTKSTTNLRPMTTKNSSQPAKNAWQIASNEAFRKLESRKHGATSHEESRSKERNKGMQSIASILNLRRDKKSSPEKKNNSCYPASNHRKVASIGCNAQNSFNSSHVNSQPLHLVSQQEDHKASLQRSPSQGKKSSSSPLKREPSAGKKEVKEMESMVMKGVNLENYAGLQHTFEYLLEKYRCDMQNAQETYSLLKQAKQAYEAFIRELLTQLKGRKEINKVSSLEKELKIKCDTLEKEKGMLEEEVKYLRLENQRLYSIMSDVREKEEGLSKGTDDKFEDLLSCPPTQKLSSNSENLKRIIIEQHQVIETLQNKEVKLMQLLYTIHRQGFDVEKLLQEEAMKDVEYSERQFMPSSSNSKRNLEAHMEQSGRNSASNNGSRIEICSLITSHIDISDIIPDLEELKEKYGLTGIKTADATPFLIGGGLNTLSEPMKDKLKLNFRGLPNNQNNSKQNFGVHSGQQPDNNAEPQGFHEEFMAKIEEFSLSWRQEALKQRNI